MIFYDFLSPRQKQILAFVLAGRTDEYIAQSLRIAKSTVKTHMQQIYDIYGLNGNIRRTQLVLARLKELTQNKN